MTRNTEEENRKRDELPCYEDALKLPKPGEQDQPPPGINTVASAPTVSPV